MHPKSKDRGSIARAVAVFAAVVLLAWFLPAGRAFAFPYRRFATDLTACYHVLHWSLAALLFARFTRKTRTVFLVPLAAASVGGIAIATHLVLRVVGVG